MTEAGHLANRTAAFKIVDEYNRVVGGADAGGNVIDGRMRVHQLGIELAMNL